MAAGPGVATRSVLEGHEHAGRLTQIEVSGTGMDANTVLALGLGVTSPWRLVNQRLETGKQPHELHLEVAADRGSLFSCPVCGKPSRCPVLAAARIIDITDKRLWRIVEHYVARAVERLDSNTVTAP